MLKILMLKSNKAYLPEIEAYKNYFSDFADVKIINHDEISQICQNKFDVVWKFMGFDFEPNFFVKKKNFRPILIHEYPSLSTGFLAKFKNKIKKIFNQKPDLRIFLNENIKNEFRFVDEVPFCLRDMGIDKTFFEFSKRENTEKIYDFVYIGEINENRQIHKLLEKFTQGKMLDKTILLIGNPKKKIYERFKNHKNIIFQGFVQYSLIAEFASRAKFGVNWIPNKYPFNLQTSTKLLEYLALNLKIINLSNDWSQAFEKKMEAKFFNIQSCEESFDLQKIENFDYKNPEMADFAWEKVLEKSKIKEAILKLKNEKI